MSVHSSGHGADLVWDWDMDFDVESYDIPVLYISVDSPKGLSTYLCRCARRPGPS